MKICLNGAPYLRATGKAEDGTCHYWFQSLALLEIYWTCLLSYNILVIIWHYSIPECIHERTTNTSEQREWDKIKWKGTADGDELGSTIVTNIHKHQVSSINRIKALNWTDNVLRVNSEVCCASPEILTQLFQFFSPYIDKTSTTYRRLTEM